MNLTHPNHDDLDIDSVIKLHPRRASEEALKHLEKCAAEILTALGLDLNTLATKDTPRRFIHALLDATEGYEGDPKLLKVFRTECRGGPDCRLSQIIEGPINFFSLCEHHALPIHGRAYVGYIPHEHIVGLSKLSRLVHVFARRFTVQERIGQEIANTLDVMLHPHGAAVYIVAEHMCLEMRGVRDVAPVTRTTNWRGEYDDNANLRSEFLRVCEQ